MKLKSLHIAIITIVFIFGSITLTSALGLWKTTNDKLPATYKSGEFKGQYDPADIKGSFTFQDIYNAYEVPIEDLAKAFGVQDPNKFASFQCKELETLYTPLADEGKEVGTGSVRYFVALYKGLPIEVEEGTYLLKPAVEILKSKAKLTQDQITSIEKYSVSMSEVSASITTSDSSNNSETISVSKAATVSETTKENADTENFIKGSTTFKDLLEWGVKKEEIEKILNDKISDTGKIIKDYATTKEIEFSSIKEPLQVLVDNIKN